jgi:hypothetical protein
VTVHLALVRLIEKSEIPKMKEGTLHGTRQILALLMVALASAALTWGLLKDGVPAPADQSSAPPPVLGGNVIAIVDGKPILRDVWEERLKNHPDVDAKRLLAGETRRLAVLAAAREAGFAEHPQVTARFEEAMIALYLQEVLHTQLADLKVPDRELQAYLDEHPVAQPEPLRRVAVIRKDLDSTDADAARATLLEAREELAELQLPIPHFGPLAQRYSDDRATRSRGGVLGYFAASRSPHDVIPQPVHTAAWALAQPGDVSDIVESDDALYLVRFVDQPELRQPDVNTQREAVRNRLLEDKRRAERARFLDDLEHRAGVRIAEEWKATEAPVTLPEPPPTPMAQQASPRSPEKS